MFHQRRFAGAILISLAVALLASVAVAARGIPFATSDRPAERVHVDVNQHGIRPDIPTLTADQEQRASSIAVRNSRVTQLAKNQSYKVTDVTVWTTEGGELLGGVVTMSFPEPITLTGEWLAMAYDCQEKTVPPYSSVPYRLEITDIHSVTVFVDLQRSQIAGINPDIDSHPVGEPQFPAGAELPATTCQD